MDCPSPARKRDPLARASAAAHKEFMLRHVAMALALSLSAIGCAHAEPLSLSCRFGSTETFDLSADGVTHEPPTPMSAEAFLSLDFAANTFAFSRATGAMHVTPERIVMMAQDEEGSGLWELDRSSGALSSVNVRTTEGATRIERWRGQCEPESGTPF